jgi:uncharacterized protein with FMN-binding domain
MRKSFVTAAVTALFVVYSFYQRTFGVPATPSAAPSPDIGNLASRTSRSVSEQAGPSPTDPAPASPSPRSPADAPTSAPQQAPAPTQQPASPYRDGTYTGAAASAFYGDVQVQVTIANGQLTSIQFPQWPNDRARSVRINQQALPMLVQEAIQAQSANVDVISGATDTSYAFAQSLQSALDQAKNPS